MSTSYIFLGAMNTKTVIKASASCVLVLFLFGFPLRAETGVSRAERSGIEWVSLPGGSFIMGSDDSREDERPPHRVTLPPFEMTKSEVTVRQYRTCVDDGACPEPNSGGPCNWDKPGREDTPLVCVTWAHAKTFAQWAGGRLPTESEWEYAARSAGKDRVYPWGNEEPDCGRAVIMGCVQAPAAPCSRPSGNTLQGLCDMAGNVWEWVADWYHPSYRGAPHDGSAWETPIASFFQVMRGGSWMYSPDWARALTRNDRGPTVQSVDVGFRIARSLAPPGRSETDAGPADRRQSPGTPRSPAWTGSPKADLGRTLFFDPRLSGDDSFACVACHQPEKAFTDGRALSIGFTETEYFRNTPTLINASRRKQLYWDARFPGADLPSLVRDHMAEAHFMNVDGRLVQERLRQAPGYVQAFREVFNEEPTYTATLDALSAFVATLNSAAAPYDRYLEGDQEALSPAARRGLDLFNGKGRCVTCHSGPLFSDGKTHARAVGENPDIFSSPLKHISFLRFFRLMGVRSYRSLREDVGHYAISGNAEDRGAFRTPSLREAARTPPYMHNGMLAALGDAVRHEGPDLTAQERGEVVEFLRSLSSVTPYVEEPELPKSEVRKLVKADGSLPSPPRWSPELPVPAPLAPLPPVPVPADNPLTAEKIALGKFLFFDERVSGNGHTSCVSCHVPLAGWGDLQDLSRDYTSTMHYRHTQTVLNAAYFSKLNWDGAMPNLEEQARDAIVSSIVGNGDAVIIEERLAQEPEYVRRFKEVFGTEGPHFGDILKALASFIRATAVSKNVPFDHYLRGNKGALSESELRGRSLFEGRANCIRCHNGALVSDEGFHATGVPQSPIFESSPHAQTTLRFIHASRGVPEEVYRKAESDPGLYLVTKNTRDIGKFRTPSLRELKYTAPYMHNGIFGTLKQVVDFYDQGGGSTPNKTALLEPLGLSPDEKMDLLAFLMTLSSAEVVDAPKPPMEGMLFLRFTGCGNSVEGGEPPHH